jgi:hypothetical protein
MPSTEDREAIKGCFAQIITLFLGLWGLIALLLAVAGCGVR